MWDIYNIRLNMKQNWQLGFFGFFALFAIQGIIKKETIWFSWLVWVIWFIYFIPKKKKWLQKKNGLIEENMGDGAFTQIVGKDGFILY